MKKRKKKKTVTAKMLYMNVMNMYDFSQEGSLYVHACDNCIQRKQQNMELN